MEVNKEDIKRIRKAFYGIHSLVIDFCKKVNYNPNLLWLLFALDDDKPKSQKQICDEWHTTKTTLNTLVKQCEKLDYVKLVPIEGQKKEKYIVLTQKGKEYARNGLDGFYETEKEALSLMKDYKSFINDIEIFYDKLNKTLNNK